MPQINLKSAQKAEKKVGNNLLERIYRLQVIKQLIRERHMAHSAEEYNESEYFVDNLMSIEGLYGALSVILRSYWAIQ